MPLTIKKLVDLDETMNNVLKKVSEERGTAPKRVMETFIIKGLLEQHCLTDQEREQLRDRMSLLMEKRKCLYK